MTSAVFGYDGAYAVRTWREIGLKCCVVDSQSGETATKEG